MHKLLLILISLLFPLLVFSQKNLSLEEKMSDQYKVQLPTKSTTPPSKIEGNKFKVEKTTSTNPNNKASCNSNADHQMQALQKQRKRIVATLAQQKQDSSADPAYIKKCEKALVVTDKEILALDQKIDAEKQKTKAKQK